MRISELYLAGAQLIGHEQTAFEAAGQMRESRAGLLVVVAQNGTPLGVLTDRDLVLRVLAPGASAQAVRVGDVMTHDVATCRADDGLFEAVRVMHRHGVRRLPVMDASGNVIGVVAADDIYAALSTHLRELSQAMAREQLHELEAHL